MEADIAELETYEDRQMFLQVGLEEFSWLIRSAYKLLNWKPISWPERWRCAWTFHKDGRLRNAGVIHTDFEKDLSARRSSSTTTLSTMAREAAIT